MNGTTIRKRKDFSEAYKDFDLARVLFTDEVGIRTNSVVKEQIWRRGGTPFYEGKYINKRAGNSEKQKF